MLVFCVSLSGFGQTHNIALSDIKVDYQPQHFYIKKIIDSRESKSAIGRITEGSINLVGGLSPALSTYVSNNVSQNKSTIGVNMLINRFDISEKSAGGKRQFELLIGIAYYAGAAKLVEFNGSAYAQSAGSADSYIDKLIRDNINGNFKQFDSWMAKNKNSIATEPAVNVKVNFARTTEKADQIVYSKNRKLYITDFEGKPEEDIIGAAATLSGISMNYQSSTLRNKTDVTVTVSIYFDKSRSWMKENGKNVTTLIHEQRHFDITAIKACQLKEQLENTEFTPQDYKSQLKDLLNKAQTEGAEMQNTYDDETEHGTIVDRQEAWNKKIDEMLSRQKCY